MKLVFDPRNSLEAHVVSHLLEQEGIETQITGDNLSGSRGETMGEDQTRVWVTHDQDYTKARDHIKEWDKQNPLPKQYSQEKICSKRDALRLKTLWFFLGLLISAFYFYAPVEQYEEDYNNDGIADTTFTYSMHGYLQKVLVDTNFDQKIDQMEYANFRGFITSWEEDRDYDGYFETTSEFEKGNISKKIIRFNENKKPDRKFFYDKNGKLRTVHFYHKEIGAVIKIEDFENERLISSRFDRNNDGYMDVKYTYDIYGNILSETNIK